MIGFLVVSKSQIPIQQVGDTVSSLRATTGDKRRSITTRSASSLLVLDVVTIETTYLDLVRTDNLREIILPDIQVLMILPGRLVPYIVVTSRPPHHCRHIRSLRKHGRELATDVGDERRRLRAGIDKDVIAGARELKIVDRGRTNSVGQFNRQTLAGLIPIVRQSWKRDVAPIRCVLTVRPFLINETNHQVHLA